MTFLLRRPAGGAAGGLPLLPEGGAGGKTSGTQSGRHAFRSRLTASSPPGYRRAEEGRSPCVEKTGQVPLRERGAARPGGSSVSQGPPSPPRVAGHGGSGGKTGSEGPQGPTAAGSVSAGGRRCCPCEMPGGELLVGHGIPLLLILISNGILSFEIPCARRTHGVHPARPSHKNRTRFARAKAFPLF